MSIDAVTIKNNIDFLPHITSALPIYYQTNQPFLYTYPIVAYVLFDEIEFGPSATSFNLDYTISSWTDQFISIQIFAPPSLTKLRGSLVVIAGDFAKGKLAIFVSNYR